MTDSTRPDEIREASFSQARRGYDKEEVERFRDEMALEIAALIERIEALEAGGSALGIEDAESLRAELATVSEDVAEVLAVAQEAAEGMRSRAAADAASWRADADKESRELRTGAQRDAEQARGDAWETASELLAQAQGTARQMLDAAAEDALFIRAEAEREALRLTGDARRDGEEIIRTARSEADRTVDAARVESEQILEAARQSAESAQERARALERRRAELMEELEAARLSIGQLEQEIDTRREALASAVDGPDAGVRVIGVGDEFDWHDDDTSVRVVPGHIVPVEEPVDADSLVAEVEALQRAIDAVGQPEPFDGEEAGVLEEPGVAEEEPDVVVIAPAATEPTPIAEPMPAAAPPAQPEPPAPPSVLPVEQPRPGPAVAEVVAPGVEIAPTQEPITEEPVTQEPVTEEPAAPVAVEPAAPEEPPVAAEPEIATAESAEESSGPDDTKAHDLDSIFARLRSPEPSPTPAAAPEPEAEIESPPAPEPAPAREVSESPGSQPAPSAVPSHGINPFDLRDRLLLPIENRVLRSVKRRIVDLQNRVLEELRVGGEDWVPDRPMLAAAVGDEMSTLAAESHVAGYTAAADLTGSSATPRPDRGPTGDDTAPFVDALEHAVIDALTRSRSAGGGSRQVAAAVSRVFRGWRTDEAERRLRRAARRSYHEGVIGGLAGLGVQRVMAVADGHPCGACPAASAASWRPGDSLPARTVLPPATSDCTATIVPVE